MPKRESSSAMSSIASAVLGMPVKPGRTPVGLDANTGYVPADEYNALLRKAKELAGSVLSQDETPMRKLGKVFGLGHVGRAEPFARR